MNERAGYSTPRNIWSGSRSDTHHINCHSIPHNNVKGLAKDIGVGEKSVIAAATSTQDNTGQ